ncbi:MAG TPA: alpha/beta hydrolase [Rhizomicrobium sp.]|nr:alpha/beta hydrolase [Rhizomicrobium sp.]
MELKTVKTRHVPVRYYEGGKGEALVFLHGAGGLRADDALLEKLCEKFHVFAPLLPGYGDSEECGALHDMLDFTLHAWDVIEALGLKNPPLVGHSMGGMIAAEMAAIAPHDVSRLALIAPMGLWFDDHPIPDAFSIMPYNYPAIFFHDVAEGEKLFADGLSLDDPEFLKVFLVANARQLGMAGKILFPIPERGLSERLYRIRAKTLLVWGDDDKYVPPVYAKAFLEGIANAELVTIKNAGHMVTMEKPGEVAAAIARLR